LAALRGALVPLSAFGNTPIPDDASKVWLVQSSLHYPKDRSLVSADNDQR
jgi:hypothetical protein